VLLFTPEKLRFQPLSGSESVDSSPSLSRSFLIIDGQHRLAALRFYLEERPDDAKTINVPCVIFDGRSEDFATEMFVIINSTPTRINKSHLVDLYERVSWAEPHRKFAAKLVGSLYSEGDSPCATVSTGSAAQPAGQVDPAGGAVQRIAPLGEPRLAPHPDRGRQQQGSPALLRHGARLPQGRRTSVG